MIVQAADNSLSIFSTRPRATPPIGWAPAAARNILFEFFPHFDVVPQLCRFRHATRNGILGIRYAEEKSLG